METSPFLHPGFIVPTALGLIGFVAWLIRLEARVNVLATDQERLNESVDYVETGMETHRSNDNVHFNQRLAAEIERRQNDRFTRIEDDLREIKTIVKGIANGR